MCLCGNLKAIKKVLLKSTFIVKKPYIYAPVLFVGFPYGLNLALLLCIRSSLVCHLSWFLLSVKLRLSTKSLSRIGKKRTKLIRQLIHYDVQNGRFLSWCEFCVCDLTNTNTLATAVLVCLMLTRVFVCVRV